MKIDLVILKGSVPTELTEGLNVISYEEFISLPIEIIEDTDFKSTRETLIDTRTRAINEKDENFAKPVCVLLLFLISQMPLSRYTLTTLTM